MLAKIRLCCNFGPLNPNLALVFARRFRFASIAKFSVPNNLEIGYTVDLCENHYNIRIQLTYPS